ncbi:NAD(P)-dependent oxidoreductase [Microbacterium sp. B2969]|uniref:NAD(P)-dependent oxidoreductase n=1 Tax=Microbacterium alkaliflavum TaxID=3248839 RepID=A0ABW7Q1T1_9MICO
MKFSPEEDGDVLAVGFIGVGAMGSPMARHALAIGPVTVFDVDTARLDALAMLGAHVARSPREVAERADVLVVMVATPVQLDTVLFGEDGAEPELRAGQTLIVMASVGVEAVRAVAARLEGRGLHIVDAPVTGGVARAETAELTILAGGSEAAIAAAQPVLQAMSKTVAHCGPAVGDGQAVKLVNQLLCSVHLAAAAEALAFAESLGLDPEVVLGAIQHGAASSFMLSDRGPRMLAVDEPPVLSAIDIFVKDTSLVLDAAREAASLVPLAEVAAERFGRARERGWGRRDDSKLIDLYLTAENSRRPVPTP